MNTTWFWIDLVGLQLLCFGVGYQASKKHKTQKDYFLAGKQLPFFPLLMTFVATQVGGGLILGSAEEAYRTGWKIIFYPFGAISGFLLLASFLGRRLAELPVSTVAEIFEFAYGSKLLRRIASFLSIVTLLMITAGQVLASKSFLASLNFNNPIWFFLFWMVIFTYVMWGGMQGIASIDVIQGSFFLIAFGVGAFALVKSDPFSVSSLLIQLQQKPAQEITTPWVGWFLMPCLFMLIEQDMAQRCFSAKSPQVMKRAALGSALLVFLVSLVPIVFVLAGKSMKIPVSAGNSALLSIVQATTSESISAAVACAVMMAIISTAVSLIHSISSNLSQDFGRLGGSQSSQLRASKALTLGVGLTALLISRFFESIVGVLIQSYELSVVCLFIPVFMVLLGKKGNALSAVLAMGGGLLSFVVCRIIELSWGSHVSNLIPREIVELLASAFGFAMGEGICHMRRRLNSRGSPVRLRE